MTTNLHLSGQIVRGLVGATIGVWLSAIGCNSNDESGGSAGTGGSTSTGASIGGSTAATTAIACTQAVPGAKTHPVGNYDNLSCNKANCHVGEIGGWVYVSKNGYPWVSGATITITNTDDTVLTTTSADDGFFRFETGAKVTPEYKVCVSKCPSTDCNLTPHTSTDCLSAGCHALPTLRVYVTTPNLGGTGGTGGAASGTNCTPPVSGGPYTHLESGFSVTNNQPCVNCHELPYIGGYLYDGPTSSKTVAEATLVVTPASGTPLTAVTGPDGMFFFGTDATVTVPQAITAPYTACVSKCPTATVCSITNGHTTTADCGTCHDGTTTGKVYLQ